jgi:hypothetical protein
LLLIYVTGWVLTSESETSGGKLATSVFDGGKCVVAKVWCVLFRERKHLGRCADGVQWVEPKFHKLLISMGYSSEAARIALQQSNNNVSLSIQLIHEQPSLLNVASTSKFKIKKKVLQQVCSTAFH